MASAVSVVGGPPSGSSTVRSVCTTRANASVSRMRGESPELPLVMRSTPGGWGATVNWNDRSAPVGSLW